MVTVLVPEVEDRLDGWTEIADFINRRIPTARRRAKAGMPVHKTPSGGIFAYKNEILKWEKENAAKIR